MQNVATATTNQTPNINHTLLEDAKVIAREYQEQFIFNKSSEGIALTDHILKLDSTDPNFDTHFSELVNCIVDFLYDKISTDKYGKSKLFVKITSLFLKIVVYSPDTFIAETIPGRHVSLLRDLRTHWVINYSPEWLDSGNTIFHIAATTGSPVIIDVLLDEKRHNVNKVNEEGKTPLDCALLCENSEYWRIIFSLMAKGADANRLGYDGVTIITRAIREGKFGHARVIYGHDSFEPDSSIYRSILEAVRRNQRDIVKGLLKLASRHHVNNMINYFCIEVQTDDDSSDEKFGVAGGNPALHYAASHGYLEIASLLLEYGAIINRSNVEGLSPLHLAVSEEQIEMIGLLLDRGANINLSNSERSTPLHLAASKGCIDVTNLLMDRGADAGKLDREMQTPLIRAIQNNQTASAEAIYRHKGFLPSIYINILYTIKNKHNDVAKVLLTLATEEQNKRQINISDINSGNTALHYAASYGDTEMVGLLLDHYIYLNHNIQNSEQKTPLHLAASCGHVDAIRLLMDRTATNLNLLDHENHTPLSRAISNGELESARVIYRHENFKIKSVIWDDSISLYSGILHAVKNQHHEIVKELFEIAEKKDVNNGINAYRYDGKTALHYAAMNGDVEMVGTLLTHGADVNDKNAIGRSPLYDAACEGHIAVINQLMDHDANATLSDHVRNTPLNDAIYRNKLESAKVIYRHKNFKPDRTVYKGVVLAVVNRQNDIARDLVKILVDAKTDCLINPRNDLNDTALHNFAQSTEDVIVIIAGLLIECGADVNKQNNAKETPLHKAAKSESIKMVKLLLDRGANSTLPDVSGKIPYDLIADPEIKKLFDVSPSSSTDILSRAELSLEAESGMTTVLESSLEAEPEISTITEPSLEARPDLSIVSEPIPEVGLNVSTVPASPLVVEPDVPTQDPDEGSLFLRLAVFFRSAVERNDRIPLLLSQDEEADSIELHFISDEATTPSTPPR